MEKDLDYYINKCLKPYSSFSEDEKREIGKILMEYKFYKTIIKPENFRYEDPNKPARFNRPYI